jgi:hypothetical protein
MPGDAEGVAGTLVAGEIVGGFPVWVGKGRVGVGFEE